MNRYGFKSKENQAVMTLQQEERRLHKEERKMKVVKLQVGHHVKFRHI